MSLPRHIFSSLALAALVISGVVGKPALAAPAPATFAQVLSLVERMDGKTPFYASRTQQVIRQDMVLQADALVQYINPQNYQIGLRNPNDIKGLNMVLQQNRLGAYFPKETLLFESDGPTMSEEVKDLIMGKLTDDAAALQRNYKITVAPETDVVALFPCYKLTLEPTPGLGLTAPPGQRIWVNKENGLIMKVERYWGADHVAYFVSQYDTFSSSRKPEVKLNVPKQVNKLRLVAGTPTTLVRYTTAEAAKAAGKGIYIPEKTPAGFLLRAVDVMTLYGTEIVLLRYSDGLSNMVVTYRTKPNAFLTLMAGAFALSLVEKISALSYHAPNNYAVVERGDHLVYAYGDLWMDTLKDVANSVPVPTKQGALPGWALLGAAVR